MGKGKKEVRENRKEKQNKNETIKGKMLFTSIMIITVSMVVVGVVAVVLNIYSTMSSLKQTMQEAVEIAADSVAKELTGYRNLVLEIANKQIFVEGTKSIEEMRRECEAIQKRYGCQEVGITDAAGVRILTDQGNVSSRDYFKTPQQTGKPYISDPVLREDDGTMSIFITAPIMKDGAFTGIVYLGVDASFLCDIVSEIQVGESGNAAILNSNGDTIGFADVQLVIDAYNTQKEAKADAKLKKLAQIEANMCAGKTGFEGYYYGGKNKYMAYAPIPETNGWSIDIAIGRDEFMRTSYISVIIILLIAAAAIIAAFFLVRGMANGISDPIIKCVDRIGRLAKGDLKSEVPVVTTRDETSVLAKATEEIVNGMNSMIGDVSYLLGSMAGGDFAVESGAREQYVGDFQEILTSVDQIKDSLKDTLTGIREAAGQVSAGSSQMAESATDLAEGATDQAGAVQELQATVMNVTEQVKTDSRNTLHARDSIREVSGIAQQSSTEMEEMMEAMKRINETSRKIGNIIESIEEIASQTNMLSLNASIEAARAGELGRGFAVVASEIGKLAGESAKAAVDTRELIESSIREVEAGNKITQKTADSLHMVIDNLEGVVASIEAVNEASQKQAESMQQIDQGMEQISGVVQSNSATAEETSATSEELSAQAEMLNSLVARFRLK